MYARGMTYQEIQGHLQEMYGVELSRDLLSSITDAVMDEVTAWQSRPLDSVYPVLNSTRKCNLRCRWHRKGQRVYFSWPFQTQLPT